MISGEYACYVRKAPQIDKSDIYVNAATPIPHGISSGVYGLSFVIAHPGDMVVIIGRTADAMDSLSSWTRSSIKQVMEWQRPPFIFPTFFNNAQASAMDSSTASLPATISRGDILKYYAKAVSWIDVRHEKEHHDGHAELMAKRPAPGHDFLISFLIIWSLKYLEQYTQDITRGMYGGRQAKVFRIFTQKRVHHGVRPEISCTSILGQMRKW